MKHIETTWSKLLEMGMAEMFDAHYRELNDGSFQLAPDYQRYSTLESLGMLQCYALLTDDDELVGYANYLIHHNLHYSKAIYANEDIYYVKPEYRKGWIGYNFIKYIDNQLSKISDKIVVGVKTKLDTGVLFERLGYKPFETLYAKVINKHTDF